MVDLGLYQQNLTAYWDLLRESYEALVIYAFYQFLVGVIRLQRKKRRLHDLAINEQFFNETHHLSPFKYCCSDWRDLKFVHCVKFGILQYVPVKLGMAILTFILSLAGAYQSGDFEPNNGYIYISFITNASQIWAMYCLVLFYVNMKDKLRPVKPVPKFIGIKAIVFFTFWQSVFIAFLVYIGTLDYTSTMYRSGEVASVLEDFIICIEMFIASLAHLYAYPYDEFPCTWGGSDEEPTGELTSPPPLQRVPTDLVDF